MSQWSQPRLLPALPLLDAPYRLRHRAADLLRTGFKFSNSRRAIKSTVERLVPVLASRGGASAIASPLRASSPTDGAMHTQATDYHHAAINQPQMGKILSHLSCLATRIQRIVLTIRLCHLLKHPHQPPQEQVLALLQPFLDASRGCPSSTFTNTS